MSGSDFLRFRAQGQGLRLPTEGQPFIKGVHFRTKNAELSYYIWITGRVGARFGHLDLKVERHFALHRHPLCKFQWHARLMNNPQCDQGRQLSWPNPWPTPRIKGLDYTIFLVLVLCYLL